MAPVLSLYSRACLVLLSSQASCRYTGALQQHYPIYTLQGDRNRNTRDVNRRWKWPWRRQQESSHSSRVEALVARELRRRGDFRHPGDLSDFEYNDLFINAGSEGVDSMSDPPPHRRPPSAAIKRFAVEPRFLQPQSYDAKSSAWAPFGNGVEPLKRGHILRIASWNLFFSFAGAGARASAALAHLRSMFGQDPHNLVVMLQALRQESLKAILDDEWVQQNFVLSDGEPPDGQSGDGEILDHFPIPYFTLMMVSRNLPVSNCFRVPFDSEMGRDALVVDIPVRKDQDQKESTESLRLCTTHLESLWTGGEYRFRQLAVISELLKGKLAQDKTICAALVGGDMNSSDPSEHENHRAPNVELKDVWEDEPAPTPPYLKPFAKDLTYGRARGNTWGYQSDKARSRRRLDKFLYTGSVETLALKEAEDVTGRLGRFGIGLKTKVGEDDVWVSDHFGITVGIKVV